MEENMIVLTYAELTRYTKAELWELYREMLAALPLLTECPHDRANALINIQNIRMFLARREYTPC
jgi:hypothetical protein